MSASTKSADALLRETWQTLETCYAAYLSLQAVNEELNRQLSEANNRMDEDVEASQSDEMRCLQDTVARLEGQACTLAGQVEELIAENKRLDHVLAKTKQDVEDKSNKLNRAWKEHSAQAEELTRLKQTLSSMTTSVAGKAQGNDMPTTTQTGIAQGSLMPLPAASTSKQGMSYAAVAAKERQGVNGSAQPPSPVPQAADNVPKGPSKSGNTIAGLGASKPKPAATLPKTKDGKAFDLFIWAGGKNASSSTTSAKGKGKK